MLARSYFTLILWDYVVKHYLECKDFLPISNLAATILQIVFLFDPVFPNLSNFRYSNMLANSIDKIVHTFGIRKQHNRI